MNPRYSIALAMSLLVLAQTVKAEIPPINWSGQVRLGYLGVRSDNDESDNLFYQTSVHADSYLWRPWFGVWNLDLSWSQSDSSGSVNDSSSTAVTGNGRVMLFHKSRFPFEAYFQVTDSSVDLADSVLSDIDSRTYRFGVLQRYSSPEPGGGSYDARLERYVQEVGSRDETNTTDLFTATGRWRKPKQDISALFQWRMDKLETGGLDNNELLARVDHNWNPSDAMNITSSASLNYLEFNASNAFANFTTTELVADSRLSWRDPERPLRVRAGANLQWRQSDSGGGGTDDRRLRLQAGADYDLTERLVLSGDVSANVDVDAGGITSSFQRIDLRYTPEVIRLRWGLDYNWSTGVFARNEIFSEGEDIQSVGGNIQHNVNKLVILGEGRSTVLVFGAGQSVGGELRSDGEDSTILSQSISSTLNHSSGSRVASLSGIYTWTRDSGRFDNTVQVATLTGAYSRPFGDNGTFSSSFSASDARVDSEESSSHTNSALFDMDYFQSRVFGVANLSYHGSLEFRWDRFISEIGNSGNSGTGRWLWKNQFRHFIGKLESRFEVNYLRTSRGSNDVRILLDFTRHF